MAPCHHIYARSTMTCTRCGEPSTEHVAVTSDLAVGDRVKVEGGGFGEVVEVTVWQALVQSDSAGISHPPHWHALKRLTRVSQTDAAAEMAVSMADEQDRRRPVDHILLAEMATDARRWAQEFVRLHGKHGYADEDLMLGWFANAIMAGYDEGFEKGRSSGIDDLTSTMVEQSRADDVVVDDGTILSLAVVDKGWGYGISARQKMEQARRESLDIPDNGAAMAVVTAIGAVVEALLDRP